MTQASAESIVSPKFALFFIGAVGVLCASVVTFSPALALPVHNSPEKQIAQSVPESVGIPVRLRIPKIAVDAAIERVGLTLEGRVDVPDDIANAAWFDRGPRPGEKGNSIIDGHFGSKNGISAVFRNLHTLQKGDKVYVEDEGGVVITFVVRESRRYGETDDVSEVFIPNDQKEHLNLITCDGVWDNVEKTFSQRLVVFTDKE